jgi:Family of unknown function (DUF6064)
MKRLQRFLHGERMTFLTEPCAMSLPFTTGQFFAVFGEYNRALWPAQLLLYALGVALAAAAYLGRQGGARRVALGLAVLWAWMGGVYHLLFFRHINPAATAFGVAFLLEAVLFAAWGFVLPADPAGRATGARAWIGGTVLAYALVAYPLLAWALGQRYPEIPTFGAPCPTTIATFGLLVLVRPAPPWRLLVVPLAWAVVGGSAAFVLGVREDFGLPIAAAVSIAWLGYARGRRRPTAVA